ncbi:MAG: hypothetical protein RSC93_10040 [Erysipelotrichaceae bacterium]
MSTPNSIAKELLNAVWNEDVTKAREALFLGASPDWIFNGYPILMHAIFTRNQDMVMLLIDHGASDLGKALGFALERGIGELVLPLMLLGIVPESYEVKAAFGPYPDRFAPLGYTHAHLS